MVLSLIYYMYNKETFVGKTAMKIGQNRFAMALVAIDAVCWGALLFFGIHYFTSLDRDWETYNISNSVP